MFSLGTFPAFHLIPPLISNMKKHPSYDECVFMAGTEGFEPPNAWTKTRCLTTWRRPTTLLATHNICDVTDRFYRIMAVYSISKLCSTGILAFLPRGETQVARYKRRECAAEAGDFPVSGYSCSPVVVRRGQWIRWWYVTSQGVRLASSTSRSFSK